jgi:hypothetical protein
MLNAFQADYHPLPVIQSLPTSTHSSGLLSLRSSPRRATTSINKPAAKMSAWDLQAEAA